MWCLSGTRQPKVMMDRQNDNEEVIPLCQTAYAGNKKYAYI